MTYRANAAFLFALACTVFCSALSQHARADEYVTPACPSTIVDCLFFNPADPTPAIPIFVLAEFYSGYPWDASAPNPTITITGNAVVVDATYSRCDCGGFPEHPASHSLNFTLPALPVGTYTLEVRLKADPSYPSPPPVYTGSELVDAWPILRTTFTVLDGRLVVEYFDPTTGHYFMTPLANEIALLDTHQPAFANWVRTGYSFPSYLNATAPTGTLPICRFFNDSFGDGKSSHFYAAQGLGCAETITQFPDWRLESLALFNVSVPTKLGTCPNLEVPVYRLYNNGQGGAPNHRFVTDAVERQRMIDMGWTPEGYGIGVAMCAIHVP